jgi:hypothetical protein|tara:strand:- start:3209 stop:3643 length:435 start_codon:yes stop_codon:yes gene_type:complete
MRTTERTWGDILQSLVKIAKENGFEYDDKKVASGSMVLDYNYYALIFRHDFAKALWGEEESYKKMLDSYKSMEEGGMSVDYSLLPPPSWKRNLEALVLVEDKYLFLERHLDHIESGLVNVKLSKDEVDERREALVNSLRDKFKK